MSRRAGSWSMPMLALILALPAWVSSRELSVYAAADFADSVGMNTHLRHKGSVYDVQFELLKQKLREARIKHIRDGAMDRDGGFNDADRAERFAELGRAGMRITFIFRPLVPRAFVEGWPARVSPAFEAYELPNELNQRKDLPWAEALRVWMPLFREYTSRSNYPVLGPSIADVGGNPHAQLGDQRAFFDFGNLHKYYRAHNPATQGYGNPGSPPCEAFRYGALSYALCQVRRVSGDKPIICTEAGYATAGDPGRAVPPEIQARYLARMLVLHFKAGIRRTFVYQLADHGKDGGGSFGLLDAEGNDKPAFRVLVALMRELSDERRATGDAVFELGGELDDVEGAAFARSDGSYRLLLWIEKPSVDARTSRPVDVTPQRVSVELPRNFRARRIVTFAEDGRPREARVMQPSQRVTIQLTDNVAVLDVGRAS